MGKKWTPEFRGDKNHDAWALVDEDGNEREPSFWYDTEDEAQYAADLIARGAAVIAFAGGGDYGCIRVNGYDLLAAITDEDTGDVAVGYWPDGSDWVELFRVPSTFAGWGEE